MNVLFHPDLKYSPSESTSPPYTSVTRLLALPYNHYEDQYTLLKLTCSQLALKHDASLKLSVRIAPNTASTTQTMDLVTHQLTV